MMLKLLVSGLVVVGAFFAQVDDEMVLRLLHDASAPA